jgi:hypothetical protein
LVVHGVARENHGGTAAFGIDAGLDRRVPCRARCGLQSTLATHRDTFDVHRRDAGLAHLGLCSTRHIGRAGEQPVIDDDRTHKEALLVPCERRSSG